MKKEVSKMSKLTVKDFKYFNEEVEVVSADTKKLIALVVVTEDRIVYHVIQTGNNVISLYDKFEKALEEYNKLP